MPYSLEKLQQILIPSAKEELLPRFANVKRQRKSDGSIVTEADVAIQQRIARQLAEQWPDTAFLGEEMTAEEQARMLASDKPVWCLDPLDGTSNFASGIPYFAVSLALLQGGKVTLGLVYDPARDECFSASQAQGAMLNGEMLQLEDTGLQLRQSIAIIDFKRLRTALAKRLVADTPYASQRSFGSIALDWCWLAAGRGHIYLHGKQNIWDYAAGNFIFQQAGGHSTTLDGEAVFVNRLEKRSAVAAVDDRLYKEWTHWLEIPGH
jgi:myo-inositol-1(or 4)-monophosphatase